MSQSFTVVTRSSKLALTQTMEVISALIQTTAKTCPCTFTIVPFDAIGDLTRETWIAQRDGLNDKVRNRKWTYELEMALVAGEVNIAVHSGKDLPYNTTEGTLLYPVLQREDARDVFIGLNVSRLADLPAGARVGTNSLRRKAQILALRPDVEVVPYSGNVTTRIDPENMREKNVDGIVIAAAGLERLKLRDVARESLGLIDFMPAVSQGMLTAQIHERDAEVLGPILSSIVDKELAAIWTAERALVEGLCATCETALAGYASIHKDANGEDMIKLFGRALSVDGTQMLTDNETGSLSEAAEIGKRLAARMISKGALEIMGINDQTPHPHNKATA